MFQGVDGLPGEPGQSGEKGDNALISESQVKTLKGDTGPRGETGR